MSEPTNSDDLNLRKYSSLTPLEQLNQLEADGAKLREYEKSRRAAEVELNAQEPKKEVKP